MRSFLTVLSCTILVCTAQQPQPALGVKPEPAKPPEEPLGPPIMILVVQGEGAMNRVRSRTAKPIIVEVRDTSDKPVADAEVIFQLPLLGPSGRFKDSLLTQTVRTDVSGRARTNGYGSNDEEGRFNVKVLAAAGGRRATLVIGQSNGSRGTSQEARSSHKTMWVTLGILGAGVAAIGAAAAATHGGNGTATALNPVTISAGPVLVGGPR